MSDSDTNARLRWLLKATQEWHGSPLHLACRKGWLDTVRALLTVQGRFSDMNSKDSCGDTPLHIACLWGHVEVTRYLLTFHSCGINSQNNNGDTPLHRACYVGIPSLVDLLVHSVACDINCQNKDSKTALHQVCNTDKPTSLSIVKILLGKRGCLLNCVDNRGNTPLHYACQNGNVAVAKVLINQRKCDIAIQNEEHATPLHETCRCNSRATFSIAQAILSCDKESNLNCQDIKGNTPLHYACASGNSDTAMLLISDLNCDVHLRNQNQRTPLHEACTSGLFKVAHALIEREQTHSVNCRDVDKNTPLHEASYKGSVDIAKLLASKNADINCQNKSGESPLHCACKQGNAKVVKFLTSLTSCDINCQNKQGSTPLHYACQNTNITTLSSVQTLVRCGKRCTINCTDKWGNTPLHYACFIGNYKVVEVLCQCDACKINCQNASGRTPLHEACRSISVPTSLSLATAQALLNSGKKCKLNCTGRDGCTPLQYAHVMGNTAMCKLLLKCSDYHLDIDCVNSVHDTMLHVACASSDVELTELLLKSKGCAVNLQNNKGQTALHLACEVNTAASLQIVHLLLYCKQCDTAIKDGKGDTPLHYACREANAVVVQLLIGTEGCDVNSQNAEGKTPLHEACMCFGLESADVVKSLLMSSKYCDVNCEDDYGSTPLHYACESGQLQIVKLLLSTGDADPMLPDRNGRTPFQITHSFHIIRELSKYIGYSTTHPVEPFVKVFVIGNHAAGKSTLVKVLTEKASGLRKFMPHYWNMVYKVESPTAGIIPVRMQSKQFGNVILYDFAGQSEYYSSHSAIIENAISSSAPVFIIVVNLLEDVESIAKTVQFWIGFIENHCSQVPVQPHVIALGSHADLVKKNLQQKSAVVRRLFEKSEALHFVEFVALDCRLLASVDLNTLRSLLATSCSTLRDSTTVSLGCHILTAFLQEKFLSTSIVACKVKDVLSAISRENVVLPQSSGKLFELLSTLHEREQILLLQSSGDPLNSWVVFDKAVLLSEVNGSLFAPKNFRQHRDYANSTGVVPLSKIKQEFSQYDPEMITSFLILLEFCQVISDPATLAEIQDSGNVHQQEPNSLLPETAAPASHNQGHSCASLVPPKQQNAVPTHTPDQKSSEIHEITDSRKEEQYYFFPALVGIKKPVGVWAVCDVMVHKFGWCLQCINADQFLSSRFLHVMLLRLAFQFALPLKKTHTRITEEASPVLTRRCHVWKNGIHWLDQSGCEVLVELGKHNQRVTLMIQHKLGGEVLCAKLRSAIIKAILKAKTRFCWNVKVNEYLIHPTDLQYPIPDEPILFSMKEIVESITDPHTKPEVIDCSGSLSIPVKQLLGFEPYVGVSLSLLERFYSKDSDPELVLHNLAEETSANAAFFQQIISPRSGRIQECNMLFQMWLAQSVRAAPLEQFRREIFDDYSILCGRSPIDLLTGVVVQASKATMAPEVHKPAVASSKVPSLQSYAASTMEATLTIDALFEVNTKLVSITDWYRLGVALAIPSHHLDVIQANHSKDVTRCLTEVLAGWLQKRGNVPNLKTLVSALEHLGKWQLAADVTRTLAAPGQDEGDKIPHSTVDTSLLGEASLREVEQEVSTVGRRWFHLGLALGLSYNRLEATEADNPGECHSALIRVLQAWLKGQDRVMEKVHPCSWRALVIALESPLVSKPDVANTIAIFHSCQHS